MNKFFDYDVLMGIKESEKPHIPLMDELLSEVLAETEKMMWSLARNTTIPGYDADDLMQEMRIKVWQVLKKNNYDPEKCKETSFFYRVCKNLLIDLNKLRIINYKSTLPKDRRYRDNLDNVLAEDNEDMYKLGGIQANFVRNFSKSFQNLVLLDEEFNEKRRTDKKSSGTRYSQHQK